LPSTPTGSRSARRHVGVRFLDYLEAAVRIAGAHKILFGSDGPLLHPGLELCKIRLLELNPEEEALFFGGTPEDFCSSRRCARGAVGLGRKAELI